MATESREGTGFAASRSDRVSLRAVARNAGYLVGSQGTARLVRFVYLAVLARALGPELLGLLVYSHAWYLMFLPITSIGTRPLMARALGASLTQGAEVANAVLALRLVVLPVVVAACLGLGTLVEPHPTARALLWIGSIALAARGIVVWTTQVFIASERGGLALRQDMVFRPLEMILGLLVLAGGGGVIGVAVAHAAVWGIQAAAGLRLAGRLLPVRPRWDVAGMPAMLRTAATMVPVAFAGAWFLQGPISLVRHWGADGCSLGCFGVNMQVLQLVAGIPAAIAAGALPVLSRAGLRSGGADSRYLRRVIPIAIGGAAVCASVGQLAGPWLLPLVLGPGYRDAGAWLGTMLTLLIPFAVALLYSEALLAVGCDRVGAIAALTGSVLLIVLAGWLHGSRGGAGVVLAAGIGASVWALMNVSRAAGVGLDRRWHVGAVSCAFVLFVAAFLLFERLAVQRLAAAG